MSPNFAPYSLTPPRPRLIATPLSVECVPATHAQTRVVTTSPEPATLGPLPSTAPSSAWARLAPPEFAATKVSSPGLLPVGDLHLSADVAKRPRSVRAPCVRRSWSRGDSGDGYVVLIAVPSSLAHRDSSVCRILAVRAYADTCGDDFTGACGAGTSPVDGTVECKDAADAPTPCTNDICCEPGKLAAFVASR